MRRTIPCPQAEDIHTPAGRSTMAKFMDVHDGFVGVTQEQLEEAHSGTW
jgi:hypothetical protein